MIAAETILTETAFHRLEGYASDSGSFVVRGWCDDKLVETYSICGRLHTSFPQR